MKNTHMKITNEWLEECGACTDGKNWWAGQKEKNGIKVCRKLLKLEKYNWFQWLVIRLMTHEQKVAWAIFCAEQVIEIYEKKYPEDQRPRQAIEAAKTWLKDPSEKNKNAAYAADAAYAAYAAYAADVAYAAANAAYAADAAYAATAATYAADYAAYAATYAAYAATYAANAATYAANAANAANAAANAAYAEMKKICANEAIRILKGTK